MDIPVKRKLRILREENKIRVFVDSDDCTLPSTPPLHRHANYTSTSSSNKTQQEISSVTSKAKRARKNVFKHMFSLFKKAPKHFTPNSRVQSSIDALSRNMNERFAALEDRLDSLTSLSNLVGSFNINSSDYTNGFGEIGPDSLKRIIKQQRQELQNERQEFLLSFANALKLAAESSTQGEASVSKTNGTGH
ncbi:uncharacterized protein LOC107368301 [Tetranychus urticae]|uniref:Uncharacterized protein n=1 Tax=Tetranychus urticae TaxID=32264 RepID=T1KXG1_TETUR|nr:uncharacterized protein LOC107368301 [Tetranychus urticae]